MYREQMIEHFERIRAAQQKGKGITGSGTPSQLIGLGVQYRRV
jgi:hypothetical protein